MVEYLPSKQVARVRFPVDASFVILSHKHYISKNSNEILACVAQTVERQPFKLLVVGSIPTAGDVLQNKFLLVQKLHKLE